MQHTGLTADEELNSLIYGTLLYVNIYESYKVWKKQSVFCPSCILQCAENQLA